jgi:hypothetical protein
MDYPLADVATLDSLITPDVRKAFAALYKLTDDQRGLVLCWFCDSCHRYVGPGDNCRCGDDE